MSINCRWGTENYTKVLRLTVEELVRARFGDEELGSL